MSNYSMTIVTSSTTVTPDFQVYLVDASGGDVTLTLAEPVFDGLSYIIKRIDTVVDNSVTIVGAVAGDPPVQATIDGAEELSLEVGDNTAVLASSGNWYTILGTNNHNISFQRSAQGFTDAEISSPVTLTVDQILKGIIKITASGADEGAKDITLPTAASAVDNLEGIRKNGAIQFSLINQKTTSVTIQLNTGATSCGSRVVAGGTSGLFRIRFTNVTSGNEAYKIFRLA